MIIYMDIDGVLANFIQGALDLYESRLNHDDIDSWSGVSEKLNLTEEAFYAPMDRAFWAGLSPYVDGAILLDRLAARWPIALLSAPVMTAGCLDGKRDWIAKYHSVWLSRTFIGTEKAALAGPDRLLIDDSDRNVTVFRAAGGRAVLFPRPWNARRKDYFQESAVERVDRLMLEVKSYD